MKLLRSLFALAALSPALISLPARAAAPRPLRALMICGGCCHDYEAQKKIVSEGVSARANVEWTIFHEGKERDHRATSPLATVYGEETKKDHVVIWLNTYEKGRVFATTLGHTNATMASPVYLDLVTRGLLWACGKLGDDGKPARGYGPKKS